MAAGLLKGIKAIIFDLDNTLEDFATAEAVAEASLAEIVSGQTRCKPLEFLSAFTEAKHRYNHELSPAAYSRLVWIEEAAQVVHIKIDAQELESDYWKILRKEVRLYSQALETLNSLRKLGFKLALLTDSDGIPGLKRRRIDELKLTPCFDVIVTSDDVGENKPSLAGFHFVLEKLGLPASACLMVGDHPEFDLAPAKRLGMWTVWTQERIVFDRSFPFVDFKIKKISDILSLPGFT